MGITDLAISIGIAIIIFFLIREIMCWYWKLNKIVELLEKISKKLGKEEKEEINQKNDKHLTKLY